MHRTELVTSQSRRSTMQSLNSIRWTRNRTRIALSLCSSCETTSPCGRPILNRRKRHPHSRHRMASKLALPRLLLRFDQNAQIDQQSTCDPISPRSHSQTQENTLTLSLTHSLTHPPTLTSQGSVISGWLSGNKFDTQPSISLVHWRERRSGGQRNFLWTNYRF